MYIHKTWLPCFRNDGPQVMKIALPPKLTAWFEADSMKVGETDVEFMEFRKVFVRAYPHDHIWWFYLGDRTPGEVFLELLKVIGQEKSIDEELKYCIKEGYGGGIIAQRLYQNAFGTILAREEKEHIVKKFWDDCKA